ncbi:hypothetical protein EE612_017761, partial [Oryza sativa]
RRRREVHLCAGCGDTASEAEERWGRGSEGEAGVGHHQQASKPASRRPLDPGRGHVLRRSLGHGVPPPLRLPPPVHRGAAPHAHARVPLQPRRRRLLLVRPLQRPGFPTSSV